MSDNLQHRSRPLHEALTRRGGLRVNASGLCTEIAGDAEQLGLLLDVSEVGLRLERPLAFGSNRRPMSRERMVQLEFEHPAVDELIWAKGVIRFDKLEPMKDGSGAVKVLRTSGVEIVAAAGRHLRLLRDFVCDLRAMKAEVEPELPMFEHHGFWSTAFRLG